MFTGIVTDVGTLLAGQNGRYTIACRFAPDSIPVGASIACDGCCLTVTDVNEHERGAVFHAYVSNETLARTTLGTWHAGYEINLERALRAGDELGGHMVTGHIDGLAEISDIAADGASKRFTFEIAAGLARFVAVKGSVALNGTSLTVNAVADQHAGPCRFTINLVPHTLTHTTWGRKKPGDKVNFEADIFARYVARMTEVVS